MRRAGEIALVSLLYAVAATASATLVVAAHACAAGDAGCLGYRRFLAWSFVVVFACGYLLFIARYVRKRRADGAWR